MDFNDKRFGGSNDKDRTVPPDENYYSANNYFSGRYTPENNDDFMERYGRNSQQSNYEDIYSRFESRRLAEEFDHEPPRRDINRTPQRGKKKKAKISKARIAIAVLSSLLAIIIIVAATGITALARINYNDKIENKYISSSNLKSSAEVTNILLLGVDARANESGNASRADTMMIISIDSANGCIKMTSFLRDSWVYIPCIDSRQRLNAACSYGGYSAVADTIEYNFGIKIDGYVVADFEMFKIMIDGLGGVKIDVTEEEAQEVTNHPGRYGNVTLEAGRNKLTGEQALAYCRIRKIDTDWKRTERQRTVMEAIIKKAIRSPISALRMITKIASYIDTDFSMSEIIGLASKAAGNLSGGFEQQACPFDGTWEYATKSGASVIALNVEKNKEKIAEFIYG